MIRFLCLLFIIGGTIYLAIIYNSPALVLLSATEVHFSILSFAVLLFSSIGVKAHLEILISMVEQGSSIRLMLRNEKRKKRWYGRMRMKMQMQNLSSGRRIRIAQKNVGENGDFAYLQPNEPGAYEIQAKRVCFFDVTGLISFSKRSREIGHFLVLPGIYSTDTIMTEKAKNFMGDADVYDLHRGGHDPAETFRLRSFQDGDKLQSVHWKLSAKAGELIVREKSRPKPAVAVILLDLSKDRKAISKSYFNVLASLSFSMMDADCVHFVAWFGRESQDIERIRVEDEESFYEMLVCCMEDCAIQAEYSVQELYQEKYSSETILHRIVLDKTLCLYKDGGLAKQFTDKEVTKELAEFCIYI